MGNKDNFMTSLPPKWWGNKNLNERHASLYKNTNKFFKGHFKGDKGDRVEELFTDLIDDAKRVFDECDPEDDSVFLRRKRRAFVGENEEGDNSSLDSDDDTDPDEEEEGSLIAERKVNTGDINKDAAKYTLNVARWIKYALYDQGGECQKHGHRMLYRADRLRAFMMFQYCSTVNDTADFCDWVLGIEGRDDESEGGHPRRSPRFMKKYNFHKKEKSTYKIMEKDE